MQTKEQWWWVTPATETFMGKGYLLEGETVQSRCKGIAATFASYIGEEIADKFYNYLSRGYYSLSSPIWSNYGRPRGLPISCNNSYIPDTTDGIFRKVSEIGMMTKHGAGTSAYLGDIRPRNTPISTGGFASGTSFPASLIEAVINSTSQGNVRRGNAAVYLPVEHGDIMEFLNFREEGSAIQNLSIGITVTDAWMNDMVAGDTEKQKVWRRILQKRFESGYPYIVFHDTVNNNAPDVYKDKGLTINGSNLCSEIALYSNDKESFVCDLSSMNLLMWNEWCNTDAVEVLTYFLDAVMEEYIKKTANIPHMEDPHRFAVNQRALGVGTLGYHSFLQSSMIPFESMEAKLLNTRIHKFIAEKTLEASKKLAEWFGEPPLLKGYGRRNVTLTAIAPTTSSSFILGQVSPSIEPLASNYFTKVLAKGSFTFRNPFLKKLLEQKGEDTPETWLSILDRGGSVQHLECLTQTEKSVFKTFSEISPLEIIQQAAVRQKFIDQSQSLNLLIHPNTSLKEVNQLLVTAWKLGVKSLYYQRGTNLAQEAVKSLSNCVVCEA